MFSKQNSEKASIDNHSLLENIEFNTEATRDISLLLAFGCTEAAQTSLHKGAVSLEPSLPAHTKKGHR